MRGRILIVDDERDTAGVLAELLVRRGFVAEATCGAAECLARVGAFEPDVVVTDVMMPEMSGLELCTSLRDSHPDVAAIVLTGRTGVDSAIAAMRAGAYDYISKPVAMSALEIALARAIAHVELQRELVALRARVRDHRIDGVIGTSPPMRRAVELTHRVAPSDATVLITGESGTGKELFARMLHSGSPRKDEPFVAINCGAMPAPLLESELFGHVRGAFTDASQSHEGLFVQARSGTLFLDELGEMPLEMQVKLLRVLQERKVRPVGSDHEVPVAARVIASTNRDLEQAIADRRFRADLYYRINVVGISVPPLRERGSDVLLLAHYFVGRAAERTGKPVIGITPVAARQLVSYPWPGNVRELENCIDRAVALCRLDQITIEDLPPKLLEIEPPPRVDMPSELMTLDELERRYCTEVLERYGGNKSHAARVLGIDRRSLYRRLNKLAQNS